MKHNTGLTTLGLIGIALFASTFYTIWGNFTLGLKIILSLVLLALFVYWVMKKPEPKPRQRGFKKSNFQQRLEEMQRLKEEGAK